jgi:hypothetical protein
MMKPIETNETCCKKITIKDWFKHWSYICGKPATHTNSSYFYCRKHSKMGRYVIRNGDVGEILFRCDTEEELRKEIINHPGMRMQKISSSHRKDIY